MESHTLTDTLHCVSINTYPFALPNGQAKRAEKQKKIQCVSKSNFKAPRGAFSKELLQWRFVPTGELLTFLKLLSKELLQK